MCNCYLGFRSSTVQAAMADEAEDYELGENFRVQHMAGKIDIISSRLQRNLM